MLQSRRARYGRCGLVAVLLGLSLAGGPSHGQEAAEVAPAALPIAWTPRAPMSVPRVDFGVAVVNGKIYAVGGFSGSTLALVEEYDPALDTWTRKADMPTPRRLLVVAAANGKLYAIGGARFTDPNALTYSYATEEYDPVANTWRTRAPIPLDPPPNNVLGNAFIGGAAVNGKIYVVSFNTNTPGSTATYEYDPVQNVWSANRAPVPFGQRYSAASVNGKMYVISTQSFGQPAFAEYDPAADAWTLRPGPATTRQLESLAAAANRLYAIGGVGSSTLATVEAYDPSAHTWDLATPLLTPRQSAGAAEVGTAIYAIGGMDRSGVPLASVERGQPGSGLSQLCTLTPGLSAGTLNLHFDVATAEPVVWNLWLSYGTGVGRVWSFTLPAHPGFPIDIPVPKFPAIGTIGFLTTFVTQQGIACSDWKVVNTGTTAAAVPPAEVRQRIRDAITPNQ